MGAPDTKRVHIPKFSSTISPRDLEEKLWQVGELTALIDLQTQNPAHFTESSLLRSQSLKLLEER